MYLKLQGSPDKLNDEVLLSLLIDTEQEAFLKIALVAQTFANMPCSKNYGSLCTAVEIYNDLHEIVENLKGTIKLL
jgi:hypothetical protein